jgi:hypothetical protein
MNAYPVWCVGGGAMFIQGGTSNHNSVVLYSSYFFLNNWSQKQVFGMGLLSLQSRNNHMEQGLASLQQIYGTSGKHTAFGKCIFFGSKSYLFCVMQSCCRHLGLLANTKPLFVFRTRYNLSACKLVKMSPRGPVVQVRHCNISV